MIRGARLIFTAAGFLAAVGTALAQTHKEEAPSALGSAEQETQSLAMNIDSAIKVCSELSIKAAAGRTDAGRAEKRSLEAGTLKWVNDPPEVLKLQAEKRNGAARYGQWFDPHATVWIIAYEKAPTCRILVGGSPWTANVRPMLYTKIQEDNFWKAEGAEQKIGSKLVRTVFFADIPQMANVRPMISVTAPVSPIEGGMQLSATVAIVNKESK